MISTLIALILHVFVNLTSKDFGYEIITSKNMKSYIIPYGANV